jgi:hypothetical protein
MGPRWELIKLNSNIGLTIVKSILEVLPCDILAGSYLGEQERAKPESISRTVYVYTCWLSTLGGREIDAVL